MSYQSFAYDSTAADRTYGSDRWRALLNSLISSGYVDEYPTSGITNELQVVENSPTGMSIRINNGTAFVAGAYCEIFSGPHVLTVSAAHATLARIDRVIIRNDFNSGVRDCFPVVVAGTAGNGLPPGLTNTGNIREISLARIQVNAAASQIVSANITDERGDTSVCGKSTFRAAAAHAHTGGGDGALIARQSQYTRTFDLVGGGGAAEDWIYMPSVPTLVQISLRGRQATPAPLSRHYHQVLKTGTDDDMLQGGAGGGTYQDYDGGNVNQPFINFRGITGDFSTTLRPDGVVFQIDGTTRDIGQGAVDTSGADWDHLLQGITAWVNTVGWHRLSFSSTTNGRLHIHVLITL